MPVHMQNMHTHIHTQRGWEKMYIKSSRSNFNFINYSSRGKGKICPYLYFALKFSKKPSLKRTREMSMVVLPRWLSLCLEMCCRCMGWRDSPDDPNSSGNTTIYISFISALKMFFWENKIKMALSILFKDCLVIFKKCKRCVRFLSILGVCVHVCAAYLFVCVCVYMLYVYMVCDFLNIHN